MTIHMMSTKTLFRIIRDQHEMPDIYKVKPINATTGKLARDNYDGMEKALHQIEHGFGMSNRRLAKIARKVGFMIVATPK